MKKIKYILLLFFTSTLIISCERYVEDLNDDPNAPVDANAETMLEGVMLSNQFWQNGDLNRLAMIWLNQATGSDRQYIALNNWNNITASDFSNSWNEAYVGTITQAKIGASKAQKTNNIILKGVFQVLEAHSMGTIASLWGDVPFTEASNPDFPNPKYDSQSSVYSGIQSLLDDAITSLSSGTGTIPDAKDFAYEGDASKWIALAHSLKARFYLHVKNYPMALSEAQMGITNADQDFKANFGTTYGQNMNPFFSFMVYDRDGYMDAADAFAPTLFSSRENSKTDESARARFNYLWGSPSYAYLGWWGIPNGKFGMDSNMPLVTYGEMLLIIAESEARINGLSSGVGAYNNYRNLLSTGYSIGVNNDGYNGLSLKYDAYNDADFSNGGIENSDNSLPIDAFYRELYEERYLYFIGNFESFVDFGRSNNIAGIELKSGFSGSPQRFIYPQVEINSNTNTPSPLPSVTDKTPVHQ